MSKAFVIVDGDKHSGSTTGLLPLAGVRNHDGNLILPNTLQTEAAKFWDETWGQLKVEIKALRRQGYKIVHIDMGDTVEGDHHQTTQIWGTPELHAESAITMRMPIRNLVDEDYQLIGTEAHTGKEGELDRQVAREVGCTQYHGQFSSDKIRVRIAGAMFDLCHHGPSVGNTPWTYGTSVRSYGKATVLADLAEQTPPPDVIIRAHVHRKCHECVEVGRYQAHVFITPSWQWKTVHGKRVAHAQHISDIGLLTMKVEDGRVVDPGFRLFQYDETQVEEI